MMPDLEQRVLAEDGVKLWTVRSGPLERRAPLVLCHGGPGLWDELGPVAAMVEDLLPVIRWDQRGAGRSESAGPYSIARCIADMECIRRALDLEDWVVGGHSWGAGLALRYALAHPARVRALVCISGTDLGWRQNRDRYRAERLERLGSRRQRWEHLRLHATTDDERRELSRLSLSVDFADRARSLELAAQWGYDRFPINGEANRAINADVDSESDSALKARCRSLDVATLIVHGQRDPRPLDGARALAAALPRARITILQDVGHVPWAEHAELLATALHSFLSIYESRS